MIFLFKFFLKKRYFYKKNSKDIFIIKKKSFFRLTRKAMSNFIYFLSKNESFFYHWDNFTNLDYFILVNQTNLKNYTPI